VLTPRETFEGFSNPALAAVGALFIASAALRETGALEATIGRLLSRARTEWSGRARICPPIALLSAFLNNAPIVAMMTPTVIDWARRRGLSPSRFLIPLSYSAIIGSPITVIGTSTILTVSGLLAQAGMGEMGFFELAPIGIPVALAGLAYLLYGAPHLLPDRELQAGLAEARAAAARLIGAHQDEIALTPNTSTGINVAARALPLARGEVVLVSDREFPANIYPWMNLADRGVSTEIAPVDARGFPDEARLLERLRDPAVRVLAVSFVQFSNGYKADLATLSAACRANGTFLVVDGIQGLGNSPLDVREIPADIIATGGQKWLLSPWGSGFLYVRRELIERLQPSAVGWMAFEGTDDFTNLVKYNNTLRRDARRFEVGTIPFQDLLGMTTSLSLLEGLTVDAISAYTRALAEPLLAWAREHEVRIVSPLDELHRSAIICLAPANATDAFRQATHADIGFTVNGLMRAPILRGKTGVVTVYDVFAVAPLGAGVVDPTAGSALLTAYFTGQELKNLLEFFLVDNPAHPGEMFPRTSGMRCRYDLSRPKFDVVTAIEVGDLDRGYKAIDITGKDARLFSLTCPLYVGVILVAIPKYTKGKLALVAKNKEGQPLKSKVEALETPIENSGYLLAPPGKVDEGSIVKGAGTGGPREIKEWQAIMDHLRTLPPAKAGELPVIPVDERAAEVRAIKAG